ncbi:glycosyltransferase [Rhodococcus sp. B50]|uniref:glycosyltransferase n=1 Tax=Rhodococcus sp. B50 TaxID=2682847 RepID=UPI001FD5221D|nr:glycosyltransferase [Rhodococcus sp. B50]MBS9374375.1 N-acetyl-alpha-D-glucosaminyl L-malate synthase [Rhodococcus sp. B50]
MSRPLRLMYVVPDLGVGGAERHVTTLLPRLDAQRFTSCVVCIGEPGALFSDLAESSVPATALRRSKRQMVRAVAELVREMRRFRPDIVVTRGYNAETLGRAAAFLSRVPHVVVWVHHCGDPEPRGRLRRLVDRCLDPITDAYFGVAEAQRAFMTDDLGYPPEKITVVYNGVDPSLYGTADDRSVLPELGTAGDAPIIGIVAALRPEKDHACFLRAARRVVDVRPDARFLVIGDGPCREDLETLVDRSGLRANVVFTGSRDDIPRILRALDVVVLSSYSIECFPMALLEAMASGRPAVCTAVGGVPEMLVDGVTGRLVPARDARALADGMLELLDDPELARKMGRAARERVESEFTLRRSVEGAEAALEEAARSPLVRPARFPLVRPARFPLVRPARPTERTDPIRLTLVLDQTFVGGVEVLMLEVFRHLDPSVVRPRLVCLREAGPLAEEYRRAGFDVEVVPRSGRFDPRRVSRLVRILRADRTDAVLVTHHHHAALALGRLAARLAGTPANLVAAHDMDLTNIGKRCLPRWAVSTLFLSDALVLLGPRQGEYLRREEGVARRPWSRTREVVITNGIDVADPPTEEDRARARSALGLSHDDFAVGIVARLSRQKAHQVLFEAVRLAAHTHPELRLLVIGGGDRECELRSLASDLGISDRTVFTGVRRDVRTLLPGLDVSALSSVHEGAPITVIEAMAAGLPVVATGCGCLPDMVADGTDGFLVPVGDAAALAERLCRLAGDRRLARRLGANGRERAEREYRISRTARAFESLLTDLSGRRARVSPSAGG